MTPAEKLATEKKPRKPYGSKGIQVVRIWKCNLRTMRRDLRLSMREVGKGCGISISRYFRIEQGADVQLTTVKKISQFFGKPIDYIWPELTGDDNEEKESNEAVD